MPLLWPEDEEEDTNWTPQTCPRCGVARGAEILYGLPDMESSSLRHKFKIGRYVSGGCMVSADDAQWHCLACKHEWGRRGDRSLLA